MTLQGLLQVIEIGPLSTRQCAKGAHLCVRVGYVVGGRERLGEFD